ncbi:cell division protein FtsX [Aureimonas psammosilenae]|uniref:cell division protein FtsX n=1 Tax=Aureimonas psammosilenae TaxID=2495496 RepID=UPI001F2C2783|nr:ABC transporter permease [Aureimonas psammosilenae]
MTDAASRVAEKKTALRPRLARRGADTRPAAIVPPGNVAGRALMTVIAIMTFLASLTLGAVTLVTDTAAIWESQISREITVQVRPDEGLDMAQALDTVRRIALAMPGVTGADVMDDAATSRLLSPWLGEGLDLDELPVPRLVLVGIDESAPPDFNDLRAKLTGAVPQASLDDHRAWVSRLVSMANATVLVGLGILALVLIATVLTVVFATRGAMSGNRQIVEVLHFVGAKPGFIAGEFERHFLKLGLFGALAGGFAGLLVFLAMGHWTAANMATPEADQISALFGSFAIGWKGYAGILAVVVVVGTITAITSRFTVTRQLAAIDMLSPVER